ncbi:MAG: hypothetical protein VB855_01665, partial [Pirellulaceae bacterium]
ESGISHMSDAALSTKDLPLGTLAPEAPYNQLLARAIASTTAGEVISDDDISALDLARKELWSQLTAMKAEGMPEFARFAASQHGLSLDPDGQLEFAWKSVDHRRIGYESNFYSCDLETRTLKPVTLTHPGPRIIVFATGRAFAEKNARLIHLSTNESLKNARNVMSAQVYLVGSRLVSSYPQAPVQVVAVAYDMVTSEVETPAIRIQSILNPTFIHPASMMAAERIFGELIADARFNEDGTFARSHGAIQGGPLADDEILRNLGGLVLVGGSVGCSVAHQVFRWLDQMLVELGVSESVRTSARRSCLMIHLGPTTVLPADGFTNRLSIINKSDEFVFAGNDISRTVEESETTGRFFVPDPKAGEGAGGFSGHGYHLVLDAPATIHHGPDGTVFDPVGTHFGHSLKHYSNALRDIGLGSVVQRALDTQGPFVLGDLINDAQTRGELQVDTSSSTSPPPAGEI